MHGFEVNWLAVLGAAVVRFAIGGAWFSPFAFGPKWGKLVAIDGQAAKARMTRAMAIDFFAGFVTAWVLANLLQFLGVHGVVSGARVSFFVWLGFVAMPFLSAAAYEGRPLTLFAIVSGFWLVALLAMGGLIGAW
jgi:hypothetical protein